MEENNTKTSKKETYHYHYRSHIVVVFVVFVYSSCLGDMTNRAVSKVAIRYREYQRVRDLTTSNDHLKVNVEVIRVKGSFPKGSQHVFKGQRFQESEHWM